MSKYPYYIFALFILAVVYSFSPDLGITLAILSLVILLINRAGVFQEYLG